MTDEQTTYFDEFITFDACKMYGVEFDEIMLASDAGTIARDEHLNSRGSVVYTFRRGDVVRFCNERSSK